MMHCRNMLSDPKMLINQSCRMVRRMLDYSHMGYLQKKHCAISQEAQKCQDAGAMKDGEFSKAVAISQVLHYTTTFDHPKMLGYRKMLYKMLRCAKMLIYPKMLE